MIRATIPPLSIDRAPIKILGCAELRFLRSQSLCPWNQTVLPCKYGYCCKPNIGVGTRGAPGACAPQVFSLFHICSVLQSNLLHTVPPQSKSLSYASAGVGSQVGAKSKLVLRYSCNSLPLVSHRWNCHTIAIVPTVLELETTRLTSS